MHAVHNRQLHCTAFTTLRFLRLRLFVFVVLLLLCHFNSPLDYSRPSTLLQVPDKEATKIIGQSSAHDGMCNSIAHACV